MPDWAELFVPQAPVLEVVVRGTLVYLCVTVLLRVTGQRESGGLSITDLLVVVLVAQAVAEAMSGGYESITEGLILVVTILAWSVALDAATYRFPALGRLLKSKPRALISDGQLNHRALHREFLSRAELDSQLRLQGVTSIDEVAAAYLEPNGMISVFRKDDPGPVPAREPDEPEPHLGERTAEEVDE